MEQTRIHAKRRLQSTTKIKNDITNLAILKVQKSTKPAPDDDWTTSDDEILDLKIKRCFSNMSYGNIEDLVKPRKCCPRVCYRLISVPIQQDVYRQFLNFENQGLGDSFLANCMELQTPEVNISAEIAEESNGNLELSNEIQNAINESLRDQINGDMTTTNFETWVYYVIIDHKQRIVCLQFLLNLFRIPASRIQSVQKTIIAGEKSCWENEMPEWHSFHKYALIKSVGDRNVSKAQFKDYKTFYRKINNSESRMTYNKFKMYSENQKRLKNVSPKSNNFDKANSKIEKRKKPFPRRKCKKTRDVISLMVSHLKTLSYSVAPNCGSTKKHKYISPSKYSMQELYDDYRTYFLKETNSELGLRFAIYEKLLLGNRMFVYQTLPNDIDKCPKCVENKKI